MMPALFKNVNYKFFRRLVFSVYILSNVLFCCLLYFLGEKEIENARLYAENEKSFSMYLLEVRKELNSTTKDFIEVQNYEQGEYSEKFSSSAKNLFRAANFLAAYEKKRLKSINTDDVLALRNTIRKLYSVSLALVHDGDLKEPERSILRKEDLLESTNLLSRSGEMVQSLLNAELNHVEIWQRRSLFFFNNLQDFLMIFFVLTTLFSLSASYCFSYFLKNSLRRLSEGTTEISEGNLKYRFTQIQSDEVGRVMHDFNSMARRLKSQSEALLKANDELREKTEELIEANHHKDRFLANMSHELRTPLNSVIGFAELMIKRHEKLQPEKINKYACRILNASDHLLDLISDLLEVAKYDAGVLMPVFADFDLDVCIDEIVEMMRTIADKKGLSLEYQSKGLCEVNADRRMIRQILINLINNAVKYTETGGIKIALNRESEAWKIDVSDTGIGISKHECEKIFKDFHRCESGLTSNYEGVGIGLTLSKRLVDLHGGRIIVSSEKGKGSTFSFFIPDRKNMNQNGKDKTKEEMKNE
jgi:signal transduction histidine kinase